MPSVICTTGHRTPLGRVNRGDVLDSKDDRVKMNPGLFASPDDLMPVETASAGPGERRSTRRRKA